MCIELSLIHISQLHSNCLSKAKLFRNYLIADSAQHGNSRCLPLIVQLCRDMSLLVFEQFNGNIATFDSS